jgi:hypothetical protein
MSSKRTKRRRSTLWREIHDQAKREEIVKRLVGKVIDSALNGIVAGAFALWTFFPKTVIKPTRQVSKLFVRT